MVKKHVRRVTVLVLGWALIGLGIVGLFLPILQGALFILLGLYVLSRESEKARSWLHQMRHRFPKVDEKLTRWAQWWRRRFQTVDSDTSSTDHE